MRSLLPAATAALLALSVAPAHAQEPVEDLTPPVLHVTPMAGGVDGWYAGTATVQVRATDPGPISSGVRSVFWQMTGATTANGSVHRIDGGTLTVSAGGRTTIDIEATDNNDNQTTGQIQIGVDRDRPIAEFAGRLATPGQLFAQGEQVRVEYGCADVLSGVASCTGPQPAGAWLDTSTLGEHTFVITGRDRVGNTTQVATTYEVVANTFEITRGPAISGTPVVGELMTVEVPAFSPAPTTVEYQWTRDGVAIPGATATTYMLTPDDARTQLRVEATAVRSGWQSRTAVSEPVQVLPAAITLSSPPVLTGEALVHERLLVSHGTVTPTSAAITYQWLRDGVLIPDVSGRVYFLRSEDIGKRVSVRVSATAPGHSEGVWLSGATDVVRGRALEVVGTLTVAGDARAGALLTARPPVVRTPLPTRAGDQATLAHQWLRDGAPIGGATQASYKLAAADVGHRVTVRVTATRPDPEGYAPVVLTSAGGPVVAKAAPVLSAKAKAKRGGKAKVVVTVSAPGLDPAGAVTVTRGRKVVGRGTVGASGQLTLTLARQPKGKVTWTVTYAGSDGVAPATVKVSARIR